MIFEGRSVASCRQAIREKNPTLRAVLHVLEEPLQATTQGPLAGVPYVLKDTWDTKGIPTTGGSLRHAARVPAVSSRTHDALQATGAVLLGKSNLCDLAFSCESDNHLFGPVKNPWDLSRTAGGSTGGGAAAVASGMAAFDWGTDFGGSVRTPAAFCGIVGLRLSARAWPVNEEHFPRIAPRFWPWVGMGPLARTAADCRAVMRALRPTLRTFQGAPEMSAAEVLVYGPDARTAGQWPTFVGDVSIVLNALGIRYDMARALPPPSAVNDLFNAYLCAHFLEFADSEEMSLASGVGAVLLSLLGWGRLDQRIHPNTAILLGLVALGRLTLHRRSSPYDEALEELRARVARVWSTGRLIVLPTHTSPPPRHGRAAFDMTSQAFTKLGNLADGTGIAVPFGRFASGMPRSLQILGPPGSEEAVLDLAERIERQHDASGQSSSVKGVGSR